MMKKILSCIAVSKFLITIGERASLDYVKKSEILDFSEKNKYQCADWVDYPIDVHAATGGLVGQVPVICGGFFGVYDDPHFVDDCYKVTANKAVLLGKMKTKRRSAASVVLNDSVLWVTGGQNHNSKAQSSTELVYSNGTISNGNSGCRRLELHSPH